MMKPLDITLATLVAVIWGLAFVATTIPSVLVAFLVWNQPAFTTYYWVRRVLALSADLQSRDHKIVSGRILTGGLPACLWVSTGLVLAAAGLTLFLAQRTALEAGDPVGLAAIMAAVAASSARIGDGKQATIEMAKVRAPVLLAWGTGDPLLPESAANAIARYLANARISRLMMPDVGHYPPLEVPDRIARLIVDYVEVVVPKP